MSFGKGGGLSINTGGGSLFGSSTPANQPQSGGLFGASTSTPSTSQPAPSGGLFGSSTPNANTGSSLFGGALNKPATPAGGGSLFGSTPATSAGAGAGGLFGSSTTTTSQPQQIGSLFGGALGQNTAQQGQQQQGQQQQPQPSGGLFGNAGQTAQSSTPSLFGGGTAQNQSNPSLFGATTTSQPAQTGGLFGSTMNTNTQQPATGGFFGGSTAQNNAASTTVPGVRIDVSQIRGSTRFNDLHEDLQKQIEQMDALIQQQISHHDQCAAFIDGRMKENLAYLPNDVDFIQHKSDTVETALDNDSRTIANLKETLKKDAENARITFRVLENLKLPSQFHYAGSMWNPAPAVPSKATASDTPSTDDSNTDLVSFFQAQADGLESTLETQSRLLTEIEQHLRTVEASTLQQTQELLARRGAGSEGEQSESRLRELALLFGEIQRAILNEAAKVGDCREKVVEVTMGAVTGPRR